MNRIFYVGVRIEIAAKCCPKDLEQNFNANSKDVKLFDLFSNGKIFLDKREDFFLAKGEMAAKKDAKLANFSILVHMKNKDDAQRIIKIINVLGNDKIIKEKIKTFYNKKSVLNQIPELDPLYNAIIQLNKIVPGLISNGHYYVPDSTI